MVDAHPLPIISVSRGVRNISGELVTGDEASYLGMNDLSDSEKMMVSRVVYMDKRWNDMTVITTTDKKLSETQLRNLRPGMLIAHTSDLLKRHMVYAVTYKQNGVQHEDLKDDSVVPSGFKIFIFNTRHGPLCEMPYVGPPNSENAEALNLIRQLARATNSTPVFSECQCGCGGPRFTLLKNETKEPVRALPAPDPNSKPEVSKPALDPAPPIPSDLPPLEDDYDDEPHDDDLGD